MLTWSSICFVPYIFFRTEGAKACLQMIHGCCCPLRWRQTQTYQIIFSRFTIKGSKQRKMLTAKLENLTKASCWSTIPLSYVTSESLHGYAYKFPELQSLILYCSHHASLIVVNNIIMNSLEGYPLSLMDECNKAAAEIAGCVDQAQSSLLTKLSLKFWLQAAAHGCAPSDASWFINIIQQSNR